MSSTPPVIIAVVLGVLLAEVRLSRRHEVVLREAGAIRPAGDPSRIVLAIAVAALIVMGLEGAWRVAWEPAAAEGPAWAVSGLLLILASKGLKYWAIRTLGVRWTLPVWLLPNHQLVHSGPYAYVAHPSDIAAVGELAGTAMMVSAWVSGPIMIVVFGIAVAVRVRFECRVLSNRQLWTAAPLGPSVGKE